MNAEALAKSLRQTLRERDERICDLTGQLYDPSGNHLAERNAVLRKLIATLNENLYSAQRESNRLQRSLTASRANVQHERERAVFLLTDHKSEH